MTGACVSLDADVLAVQELDVRSPRSRGVDQATRIATATRTRCWFESTRRLGIVGRYGIALFVRGTFLERRRVDLPTTPGREPRVAQLARVSAGGQQVTIAATHLQNPRDGHDPSEALRQLDTLLGLLAERPRPWILLGDLNLEPRDAAGLVIAAGLEVADGPPTFPAGEPRRHIDWVAVAGGRVRSVAVPDTVVSDHRPLVADLEIPYPAEQAE